MLRQVGHEQVRAQRVAFRAAVALANIRMARAWCTWAELLANLQRARLADESLSRRRVGVSVALWCTRAHGAGHEMLAAAQVIRGGAYRGQRRALAQWVQLVVERTAARRKVQVSVGHMLRRESAKCFASWRLWVSSATKSRIAMQFGAWRQLWRHWVRWAAHRHAAIQWSIRHMPLSTLPVPLRLRVPRRV